MMRNPKFIQNLKLLLLSYYNMVSIQFVNLQAEAQTKIGKLKNAELIFQHGLLLSKKFFISDAPITKKYKSKVAKKKRSPRPKNFVEMNKRVAKKPSSKSVLARNSSPSNPRQSPEPNNFVNININHRNSSQVNLRNRIASANPKKSRRVNSAFDNPLVPSTPPIQGNHLEF